jgi:2-polyprenyl-6-methoxyphenol hydroxylase-like FAD-dependent oxidoreductase
MAEVVVAGAGVGGLATALVMGRQGHRVTLLERDATPLPATPEEAFAWDRRGAPQVRHSHAFLARLRNLLRDHYPDVLDDLFQAGATELRFLANLPPEFPDHSAYPGDDDLVALACRRTTFEWVLRRLVTRLPGVTLRDDVAVIGTTATTGPVPTVTGFTVESTSGSETVGGDLLVAANGRRADVPAMVATHGVSIDQEVEDTGIVYFSRFYRLHDDVEAPGQSRPVGGDLGYLKYGLFPGDNRTFSMTLACGSHDDALRSHLAGSTGFDVAASSIVDALPWLDDSVAQPITDTFAMARLLNRRRSFLGDDGAPLVQRFVALGDAHTCTNPLYGRGCSLAFVHATLLGRSLNDHEDDPVELVRDFERATRSEITPWYRAAVAQDASNRRATEPATEGSGSSSEDAPVHPGDVLRDVLRDGLMPAVRTDPVVLRAFLRSFNLLQRPEQLMADSDVIARVMAVYQARGERPAEPSPGIERSELLARLAAA